MRIGIPRALLYYWYGPAWKVFFQEIGLTPVISGPTGKNSLNIGVKAAVDEVCLPVKIFLGHALELTSQCDLLLIPRYVSISKKEYICPKFMGLPEMTKQAVGENQIIVWKSDHNCPWGSIKALPQEISTAYGRKRVKKGLQAAKKILKTYQGLLQEGYLPSEAERLLLDGIMPKENSGRAIGLIGHPYCLYDSFVNLNTIDLLQSKGFKVILPEMFTDAKMEAELADLPKPLFWTLGRRILGSFRLMQKMGVEGVVYLSAFACGPEALIGEMVKREGKEIGMPLLQLDLDEHSGEAGIITRIEAFLDLLIRKRRYSCV
jgi:predicted nucleotide-binding protein (sugar kinase/HSP70/actin superfamily)